MNGIIFNKTFDESPSGTFLEHVKKNEETKKRKNLKLIFTIIFSNVFVAALFYSPEKEVSGTRPDSFFKLHAGHRMMILNISPLIQLDQTSKERQVTLLSSKKKVVLSLGYLHEELKNEAEPNMRRFKIEIPEAQTLELGSLSEEKLIAIPAIEIKKSQLIHQGSSYEINL